MIVTSEEIYQDLLVMPNNSEASWQVRVTGTCCILVTATESEDGFEREIHLFACNETKHLVKFTSFIWEGHESADFLKGIILGFALGV